jgi:hypothetical protein
MKLKFIAPYAAEGLFRRDNADCGRTQAQKEGCPEQKPEELYYTAYQTPSTKAPSPLRSPGEAPSLTTA